MAKIKVGVIFGGRSGEHDISWRSVQSVIAALDSDRYEVVPIAINREGHWLSPTDSAALLPEATQHLLAAEMLDGASLAGAVGIIGDPSQTGLVALGDTSKRQPLDVVFPVLHGTYGEDGTIQGLLEMAGIPYVGCGVLASASGMDKIVMKALFHEAGLPICRHLAFRRNQWEADRTAITKQIREELGYPCFVKPANLGSSVGISKATDDDSLIAAMDLAARYDRRLLVEEGLDAREIECAVLGNDEPEASLPGEYLIYQQDAAFLDYTEKYSSTGHIEFVTPAPLGEELTTRLQSMAKTAFQAVDGAGLARVDFFLRHDTGDLLINEINTLPGLTNVSGYPKMWAASGKSFAEVLDTLIRLAMERHADKQRNQTSR